MTNELIGQEKNFDLSRPQQAMAVAETLQRFVKEKNLVSNIKGKMYPQVEAWQFAGSQLGLYPILIEVQNLSKTDELKYGALVEVRKLVDNSVVSKGYAICSNKEASKRLFDEYAICSMAQTRAEGKAFRMLLSWLMKAAGFEATPAEEMDFAKTEPQEINDVPTEGERKLLRELVWNSNLDDDEKEKTLAAIDRVSTYERYAYIENNLQMRQLPIDQIQNPSQKDINQHLRKSVKA